MRPSLVQKPGNRLKRCPRLNGAKINPVEVFMAKWPGWLFISLADLAARAGKISSEPRSREENEVQSRSAPAIRTAVPDHQVLHLRLGHWLPRVPEGHKCGRMHGHTYQVILGLEGPIDQELGWVQDFGDVKEAFRPLLEAMDHKCLNEIPGLENPTAEVMAVWIFHKLQAKLPLLRDVTVCETPSAAAVYRPGD
jgi:6-pyruvoyltetrahydropterin/6-carboxytetrahydropterin synthase